AWTEIESTLQHLKASEKALELAMESLRLAEVGFREGVTPQLDLLNAQTSLTSSRLDYARSQYNHLLTIVALKVTEATVIEWTGERRKQ
ncbi:MAG: TolC family protein, partial [Synergistaceae bacterium]|nr:TolC family protein [Synergistaceae bacterium]